MLLSISEETNLVISYAKAKDSDVYTCQIGKLFFFAFKYSTIQKYEHRDKNNSSFYMTIMFIIYICKSLIGLIHNLYYLIFF